MEKKPPTHPHIHYILLCMKLTYDYAHPRTHVVQALHQSSLEDCTSHINASHF